MKLVEHSPLENTFLNPNLSEQASFSGSLVALEDPTSDISLLERALGRFVRKGGPVPEEYDELLALIGNAAAAIETGRISREEWSSLLDSFGPPFAETLQGFSRQKPYGYSGDFEIIDRIYTKWTNPDASLARWDHFLHAQAAPCAVRNRKAYFASLLLKSQANFGEPLQVLNVGSGPGRDLLEFFRSHPADKYQIVCLDHDARAHVFARQLCSEYLPRIEFVQKNALRFRTEKRFHLIWSAGLFDYLDDDLFVFLLQRLRTLLVPGGRLVAGNFALNNPTKDYMELMGSWFLNYRSAKHLIRLASAAGFDVSATAVESEATGVNLFLHVRKDT